MHKNPLFYNKSLSTAAAYDVLAKGYYEARKYKKGVGYFYNCLLEWPSTLKLLGDVRGKKILDVGCGPGLYASLLIKKGAVVKGIDISSELIRIAKQEAPTAEFIIGDAERLPYKNSEFDIVIAPLVLHYLNSWDEVLKEIHAVLKKGGIFIFSQHNPFTEKLKKKKWFFKKFRVIEGYFDEAAKYSLWNRKNKGKKVTVVHYHKTYATIIKLLMKHGFEIIDYEDCKPLPEAKELFPAKYKKCLNYPPFCAWKLRKN
jgi:ubiquinone/menaquinone biosynthesis C-methylase UbiE